MQNWNSDLVSKWLLSLKVGRDIAERFREEEINGEVLQDLIEDDLISLGIKRIGARKLLLLQIIEEREKELEGILSASGMHALDVECFLSHHGFGEDIVQRFKDEEISSKVLLQLSEHDLEILGINKVGRRKLLFRQIQILCRCQHRLHPIIAEQGVTQDFDVSEWLSKLGFNDEAIRMFTNEGVDSESLLSLTERDLKSIGLSKLGQRKILLRRIHELKSSLLPASRACGPVDEVKDPSDRPLPPDTKGRASENASEVAITSKD